MKLGLVQTQNMKITDLDQQLIKELREGARTQGYLIDEMDESRSRIHRRLQLLDAAGYIEKIHETTALYEFRHGPDEEET